MKYFKDYKEAYRANNFMCDAMSFARNFSGSPSELEKELKEKFPELSGVVRTELILLHGFKQTLLYAQRNNLHRGS